jgi:RsiW-degrading membrane proteinase PrsW (M82 family)
MDLKQVLNTTWGNNPLHPSSAPWILLLNIVLTYLIEFGVIYLFIRRHPIKSDLENDLILAILIGNVITGFIGFIIYIFVFYSW